MAKEIFHYGSRRFSQVVAKSVIEVKLPRRHHGFLNMRRIDPERIAAQIRERVGVPYDKVVLEGIACWPTRTSSPAVIVGLTDGVVKITIDSRCDVKCFRDGTLYYHRDYSDVMADPESSGKIRTAVKAMEERRDSVLGALRLLIPKKSGLEIEDTIEYVDFDKRVD